ncbi:MAG: hypothetical protein WBL50_06775 [Candidatus Acidiferrum sp.]
MPELFPVVVSDVGPLSAIMAPLPSAAGLIEPVTLNAPELELAVTAPAHPCRNTSNGRSAKRNAPRVC